MKIVEYTTEQLRRIVCALRRKLAQAQAAKPSLLHDASSNQYNVKLIDATLTGPLKIFNKDPRRIAVWFQYFGSVTGAVMPGPVNQTLYNNFAVVAMGGLFSQGMTFYSYQFPAMVTDEWWFLGPASGGAVANIVGVEEIYLG